MFLICFSTLSCWTNRATFTPSSSTFLHSCKGSCLFASDTHCSNGPASMSVDVSTSNLSSYMWCYHFFSQRKQIQASSIILLLLPIRIFQHPKYKCIYRNSLKVQHLVDLVQVYSLTSLSRTWTPLRNSAGISDLFFLSVPTTVMFLDKRNFASSQLVKKLSVVTPLLHNKPQGCGA